MLPNLSRLKLHDDDDVTTSYEASDKCPTPADVGDLRNGSNVRSGTSATFQLAADPITPNAFETDAAEDWQEGTLCLEEDTTFIHVASAGLPTNLQKSTMLRTQTRTYAHTELDNWTWNEGDRVIIHWSAGLPFQTMGSLNSNNRSPYQRSCKLLNRADSLTLEPSNEIITWPFANVATLLPPAFYTVAETPLIVQSPKEFARSKLSSETWDFTLSSETKQQLAHVVDAAVEFPQEIGDPWDRNTTVFSSSSENEIVAIQILFLKENSPYQRYELKRVDTVVDYRKRRRSFLVLTGFADSNMTYTLKVSRTSMYKETHLRAHYIDFSGYVFGGAWLPEAWNFFNPYKEYPTMNGLVLINNSLRMQVYLQMLTIYDRQTLETLKIAFDDEIINGAVDVNAVPLRGESALQLQRQALAHSKTQSAELCRFLYGTDDIRQHVALDKQEAMSMALLRKFETLEEIYDPDSETLEEIYDPDDFKQRCKRLVHAFVVLLRNVQPEAFQVSVSASSGALNLPLVFKKLIVMLKDSSSFDTLMKTVRATRSAFLKDELFYELKREDTAFTQTFMQEMETTYNLNPQEEVYDYLRKLDPSPMEDD